jgi:2,4-dienoyl-CoA reductase (NADPH2)
LFEKSHRLGGLLPIAAVVKGFHPENLVALVRYYIHQMKRLNVKVSLGKAVDLTAIKKVKPDVLIITAGGILSVPDIKGIDRSIVVSGPKLHKRLKFFIRFFGAKSLRFLTMFYIPLTMGKRVVIIGGALQGCEMAEFLVKRGRKVTIVEKSMSFGDGMTNIMKEYLLMWFEKKGVQLIGGVKDFVEITKKGLTIIDSHGKSRLIEADTIIPAMPLTQNAEILKAFEGKVPEIYAVGDCKEPGLIADAIGKGLQTAMTI